jgi:hypothetical protein
VIRDRVEWSVLGGCTEDVNEDSVYSAQGSTESEEKRQKFASQLLHVDVLLRPDSSLFKHGSIPGTSRACMPVVGYGSNSTFLVATNETGHKIRTRNLTGTVISYGSSHHTYFPNSFISFIHSSIYNYFDNYL